MRAVLGQPWQAIYEPAAKEKAGLQYEGAHLAFWLDKALHDPTIDELQLISIGADSGCVEFAKPDVCTKRLKNTSTSNLLKLGALSWLRNTQKHLTDSLMPSFKTEILIAGLFAQ